MSQGCGGRYPHADGTGPCIEHFGQWCIDAYANWWLTKVTIPDREESGES